MLKARKLSIDLNIVDKNEVENGLESREIAAQKMKERRKKRARRRKIGLTLTVIAGVVLLFFLFSRDERDLTKVRVEEARIGTVVETIGLTPVLKPSLTQNILGADLPIQELYVEIGDQVKKGDKLLSYDISSLKEELEKTRDLIAKTKESMDDAVNEALDLSSQLNLLGGSQIESQIAAITGSLGGNLGNLAAQMVDIQGPFMELGQKLGTLDMESINAWLQDMQALSSKLRAGLDQLEESNAINELIETMKRLSDLEKSFADLAGSLEEMQDGWREWMENNPLPSFTLPNSPSETSSTGTTGESGTNPQNSSGTTTDGEGGQKDAPDPQTDALYPATSLSYGSTLLADQLNADPIGHHSSGASALDLSALSPEMLEQMQQMLGSYNNTDLLTSSLSQGEDLLIQLEEAEKQQLEIIEKLRKSMTADFPGIIVKIDTAKGELAPAGREIMVVYSNEDLKTVAYVGHADARRLQKGQKVSYSLENMQFNGEVIYIDPVASDSNSFSSDLSSQLPSDFGGLSSLMGMGSLAGSSLGSEPQIKVEMSIEGKDLSQLIMGFAIDAEVETRMKENVLTLSAFSLLKEKGDYYLFIVDENQRIARRDLEIGLESALFVEVLSGVSKGERVVLSPSANLANGLAVEVVTDGD